MQGSGWGWLGYNSTTGRLQIATKPNQDPLLELVPLLGIDVWEHAYYYLYGPARAEYLKNICQHTTHHNTDWCCTHIARHSPNRICSTCASGFVTHTPTHTTHQHPSFLHSMSVTTPPSSATPARLPNLLHDRHNHSLEHTTHDTPHSQQIRHTAPSPGRRSALSDCGARAD